MRDCVEFLKWLNIRGKNKCNDLITYIDVPVFRLFKLYLVD
jgi:hypothetical protein